MTQIDKRYIQRLKLSRAALSTEPEWNILLDKNPFDLEDILTVIYNLFNEVRSARKLPSKYALIGEIFSALDSESLRPNLSGVYQWMANQGFILFPAPNMSVEQYEAVTLRFNYEPNNDNNLAAAVNWIDVTISFMPKNRITFTVGKRGVKSKAMSDLQLINKRTDLPNSTALALIGLAQCKKYPPGITATQAEAKIMSNIRRFLRSFTGLKGDPFYMIAQDFGWKPKFTLLDRRNADDLRAKEKGVSVAFNDGVRYDVDENDEAAEFLKQNEGGSQVV